MFCLLKFDVDEFYLAYPCILFFFFFFEFHWKGFERFFFRTPVTALTSAPISTRYMTTGKWPFSAAKWRAVFYKKLFGWEISNQSKKKSRIQIFFIFWSLLLPIVFFFFLKIKCLKDKTRIFYNAFWFKVGWFGS